MKAFAIFDGGGAKGAALAGCLAAAQQQGVEFIGYGGTSAGSIVASLASVGYTGKELEKLLVEELDFVSLLDDNGRQLSIIQGKLGKVLSKLSSGNLLQKGFCILFEAPQVLKALGPGLGLYGGEKLKSFLLERIKEKQPSLAQHADITFQHLDDAGCLPLKIVASDITLRKPAIFSRDRTDYGASVIDAVRASTSYPFVFQPVEKHGRRLLDGGLCSNLPAFLFDEEYQQTGIPALAFDLVASPGQAPLGYGLPHLGNDMMSTALEASDELLRGVLRGVHHVPVVTPSGIDTLTFALSKADRKRLFDAGYSAAGNFLSNFAPLLRVRMAGNQLQQKLQAEHGPVQLYQPVLYGLAKQIELETKARDVRAAIMLPTGRPVATRIVVHHYNMDGDADADLELPENAGCSGAAWKNRTAALADLEGAAKDPTPWGMSTVQHAKVPPNRKSMLAVPIHRQLQEGERDRPAPVGTLSVDSTTPLEQTNWLAEGQERAADSRVVAIMMSWAYVVYKLLR